MKWVVTAISLLLLPAAAFAQLSIENPKNIDLPKQKAEVIYHTACRVVAEEFRLSEASKFEFPLTLVMGEKDERYTANDEQHSYVIHLAKWNEQLFASSTMMLAIHRLVPRERQQQMLLQILKRANGVAPVSVSALQEKHK